MKWLTQGQYAAAMRDPATAFEDPRLRVSRPARGSRGGPLQLPGHYATVFRLEGPGDQQYAVRCLYNPEQLTAERYQVLAAYLVDHVVPEISVWEYLPAAIKVGPDRFPVLLSEWRRGMTLDLALKQRLDDAKSLRRLADRWAGLVHRLENAYIAHGDLQHGNILVDGDVFALVDPDGMWTPTMARLAPPAEAGHENYRHPRASRAEWGQEADRFSAHVIELSLLAVAAEKDLWKYHDDHNLILKADDLATPEDTALWARLASSPDLKVREFARVLAGLCRKPPDQMPTLRQTLKTVETLAQRVEKPAAQASSGHSGHRSRTTVPPPRPPVTASAMPKAPAQQAPPKAPPQNPSKPPVQKAPPKPPRAAPTSPPVKRPAPPRPRALMQLTVLTLLAGYGGYHWPTTVPWDARDPILYTGGTWLIALAGLLLWPRARPFFAALSGGAGAGLLVLFLTYLAEDLATVDFTDPEPLILFYAVPILTTLLVIAAAVFVREHTRPAPGRTEARFARRLYLAGVLGVVVSEGVFYDWWYRSWADPPSSEPLLRYSLTGVFAVIVLLLVLSAPVRRGAGWLVGMALVLAVRPATASDKWSWPSIESPWDHIAPDVRWSALAALLLSAAVIAWTNVRQKSP